MHSVERCFSCCVVMLYIIMLYILICRRSVLIEGLQQHIALFAGFEEAAVMSPMLQRAISVGWEPFPSPSQTFRLNSALLTLRFQPSGGSS